MVDDPFKMDGIRSVAQTISYYVQAYGNGIATAYPRYSLT